MSGVSVQQLLEQNQRAEQIISTLSARVDALEQRGGAPPPARAARARPGPDRDARAGGAGVAEFQSAVLQELTALRERVLEDQRKAEEVLAVSAALSHAGRRPDTGPGGAVRACVPQERDRLAKENEKLHYRVNIMKRELEAAEKKQ